MVKRFKRSLRRLSKEEIIKIKRRRIIAFLLGLSAGILFFFNYRNLIIAGLGTVGSLLVVFLYFYFKDTLKESARIKKIEDVFPDFLQLVSSNLRAGMTIDRSILISSRKEFAPLDEEILKVGKDITTGKA